MPLWIIGIVGILALVLVCVLLRAICAAMWELCVRLDERLREMVASTNALVRNISYLTDSTSRQLTAIQRLLKPVAYVSESQVQSMEAEHLAEVSRSVDHTAEAVEQAKKALVQKEKDKARAEEEWKRSDAEMQAKVREEHRLIRTQRVMELHERVEEQGPIAKTKGSRD